MMKCFGKGVVMDIKVEDYVRTKSGFIGKVIGRHGGYGLHYELDVNKEIQENLMNGIVREDNITKHSFNLIDLIEVEDIVVMLDTKFNTKDYIFIDDNEMLKAVKKDLKDRCELLEVLTHQQFEANAYKVR